jgi:hypothetical protein
MLGVRPFMSHNSYWSVRNCQPESPRHSPPLASSVYVCRSNTLRVARQSISSLMRLSLLLARCTAIVDFGVVLAIGRFLRMAVTGSQADIVFDEMPGTSHCNHKRLCWLLGAQVLIVACYCLVRHRPPTDHSLVRRYLHGSPKWPDGGGTSAFPRVDRVVSIAREHHSLHKEATHCLMCSSCISL